MFSFQQFADALEKDELSKTLSTYSLLVKAGLATKTLLAEVEKYPASHEMIANLKLENKQEVIDVLYTCKTLQQLGRKF